MGIFGGYKPRRADTRGWVFDEQKGTINVGDSMDKPKGFWQGGEDVRGRDILAAALAAIGDTFDPSGQGGAVDALTGRRNKSLDMAEKAQKEAQQRAALMAAAQRRGINPNDVELAQGGLGELIPKQPELPSDARLAQWHLNATPEERAAFDKVRPIITHGYGSAVVPREAMPTQGGMGGGPQPGTIEDGHQFIGGDPGDPKSWKPVAGGGAGNGVGSFPRRFR